MDSFRQQRVFLLLLLFSICCQMIWSDAVPSKVKEHPVHLLRRIGENFNKPEQIHVSFGSRPTDIVIMWSSSTKGKSFVEFGYKPQNISRIAALSTELKEHSKNAKSHIYRAELKNLAPGRHYTYRIVSGPSGIKSNVLSVDVPHDNPGKSHTYMVVADMGLLTKSLQFIVHEALSNRYEAVFHVGDIAYDLSTQEGSRGDQFMNRIQKFSSKVPYMTTPGDHERFDNFYHYRNRFSAPGVPWPMKESALWYSLDVGHTHFVSINTQAVRLGETFQKEQIDWLTKDLMKANQNRRQYPWIIVMGHKPIYCTKTTSEEECDRENSLIRDVLEKLFFDYGVDLYISGHKHCYERSFPLYKNHALQMNTVEPKAPIYIIIGSMGYEYMFHEQKSAPKWLAASVTEKGKELFARLNIVNGTHLTWSAHVATNNKKVDEMKIVQHRHGPFGDSGMSKVSNSKSKQHVHISLRDSLAVNGNSAFLSEKLSVYDPSNRYIMLGIGSFSFFFLIFLFLRYTRIKIC